MVDRNGRSRDGAGALTIMSVVGVVLLVTIIGGLTAWCVNNVRTTNMLENQQQQVLDATAASIGATKGVFLTNYQRSGKSLTNVNNVDAAYTDNGRDCRILMGDDSFIECVMIYNVDDNTYVVYNVATGEPVDASDTES